MVESTPTRAKEECENGPAALPALGEKGSQKEHESRPQGDLSADKEQDIKRMEENHLLARGNQF